MKIISNKTQRPLRIPLRGGKTLHLGPLKSGQISGQEAETPAVRRLVDAGEIEISGDGTQQKPAETGAGAPHESTHGHHPKTVVLPKGNR